MLSCCVFVDWTISDASDIANIIIAVVNLFLAFYIFVYQINRDSKGKKETLRVEERNIRLQWFKELIIQPNIDKIYVFYSNLHQLEEKYKNCHIDEEFCIKTSEYVKEEGAQLRKSFYDILISINPDLHLRIEKNIDGLLDSITEKIFNPRLNLNHNKTFDKEIGNLITASKNDLIATIYTYNGE